MKKRTLFVCKHKGTYYVPRPSGWLAGWARHLWFEAHMGVKPNVASPALWTQLTERYAVRALLEDEEGSVEVRLCADDTEG